MLYVLRTWIMSIPVSLIRCPTHKALLIAFPPIHGDAGEVRWIIANFHPLMHPTG